MRSLIFSSDLRSLYPHVHFVSLWLSGVIDIKNNNGDSASHWNIPLWIFTSGKVFSPAVSSTLQFFVVSSINLTTSLNILYMFWQSIIQLCGTISYSFWLSINAIATFFVSFYSPWAFFNQCIVDILFLFACGILSSLRGMIRGL